MASQNEPNILIPFYKGTARDHQNRTLDEILNWPDQVLEECHDYIQTLFPLPEASRFSWSAEIIDRHVFEAFRASPELREGLRRSFNRMLSFYGLESVVQNGNLVIRRADNFSTQSQNWVKRVDHNHLRITRIIRSLRILGLEKEAEAFYEILSNIYMNSNDHCRPCTESMKYWSRAAHRPLNFRPDINDISDPRSGEEFLWKYEMEKAAAENEESVEKAAGEINENTEVSRLSNSTEESDGGVLLPSDDEDPRIRSISKDEKARSVQYDSDVTEKGQLIPASVSNGPDGSSSTSNGSPSLKRKTQDKAEEPSKKAMKSA